VRHDVEQALGVVEGDRKRYVEVKPKGDRKRCS
jgi:hypothetical protein